MAIRHIFFDIDDTLFPTSEFAERARKNAVNAMIEMGLNEKPSRLYKLLDRLIKEKGSNYQKHFDDLCRELKTKTKAKYVAAAVMAYHTTKQSIFPFPSVQRTLLNLRNTYTLHIATNGKAVKQWDKLIRLKLALLFNDVFISQELRERKSISFYKRILKKLKLNPKECLMVGDRPLDDILYAKKAGFRTIRLRTGKLAGIRSRADMEIDNFYELPKAIKKLDR